jgi:hypothetical protein
MSAISHRATSGREAVVSREIGWHNLGRARGRRTRVRAGSKIIIFFYKEVRNKTIAGRPKLSSSLTELISVKNGK